MNDDRHEDDPTAKGTRYVLLDRAGLLKLPLEKRVGACRDILKHTIHPDAKEIMEEAVAELLAEYRDAHGKNAAVARRVNLSPAYIGQIASRVRAKAAPESWEYQRARLDAEMVEDYTAHPNARLRAVERVATVVETFLGATQDAAARDDWDEVRVGLSAMLSILNNAQDTVEGRAHPDLVAEAEQIEAGEAPWQQHTYRRRVTFSDDSGVSWAEHSDAAWEADNDQTLEEVAEDSGYLVESFYDRMGEYTPGRVWKIELWRDATATDGPDHVHEHVEHAPPADQVAIAHAIADGTLVRDGRLDNDLLRQFIANRTNEAGGQQ